MLAVLSVPVYRFVLPIAQFPEVFFILGLQVSQVTPQAPALFTKRGDLSFCHPVCQTCPTQAASCRYENR